jgi:hypothetical protein
MPGISATAAASGETGVRGELGLSAGCAAALPAVELRPVRRDGEPE